MCLWDPLLLLPCSWNSYVTETVNRFIATSLSRTAHPCSKRNARYYYLPCLTEPMTLVSISSCRSSISARCRRANSAALWPPWPSKTAKQALYGLFLKFSLVINYIHTRKLWLVSQSDMKCCEKDCHMTKAAWESWAHYIKKGSNLSEHMKRLWNISIDAGGGERSSKEQYNLLFHCPNWILLAAINRLIWTLSFLFIATLTAFIKMQKRAIFSKRAWPCVHKSSGAALSDSLNLPYPLAPSDSTSCECRHRSARCRQSRRGRAAPAASDGRPGFLPSVASLGPKSASFTFRLAGSHRSRRKVRWATGERLV